ncbi:MAG: aminopeptidase [Candidatus Schekmanbacteria bacterium]|nr:aminopeptidase [Candidatus Schekmanbacteria bacterium]
MWAQGDWAGDWEKEIEAIAATLCELTRIEGPGETVWLDGDIGARPLLLALYRRVLGLGSLVELEVKIPEARRIALEAASLEMLAAVSPVESARIASATRYIMVECETPSGSLAGADMEKLAAMRKARHRARQRLYELPSCSTLFPNPYYAMRAHMGWDEYLELFFRVMAVDLRALYGRFRTATALLTSGSRLRLQGPGVDLTMDVTGRRFVADDCTYWNLPDGELFSSPVETSTEGYIYFETPQYYYQDTPVEELALRIASGRVVEVRARRNGDFVEKLLAIDDGARGIGEIGIGINGAVDRLTGDVAFDEKAAGTIHIALGQGYEECGGRNESAIHWDLVKDIRRGGEISIDGNRIFRGGRLLEDSDLLAS